MQRKIKEREAIINEVSSKEDMSIPPTQENTGAAIVDCLRSSLAEMYSQLDTEKSQFRTKENEAFSTIQDIKSQMSSLEESKSSKTKDVAQLETKINELEQCIADIKQNQETKTQMESRLEFLSVELRTLQSKYNEKEEKEKIEKAQTEMISSEETMVLITQ